MWLRDGLSRDLPSARVLIYGYDSHLVNSTSFQNILDIGGKFHNALRAIRKGSKRPLVIVSHSLGGIIVREVGLVFAFVDRILIRQYRQLV